MSAKISDVEIITIAIGCLYNHVKRHIWVMEFLKKHNTGNEDIVIHLDGSYVIISNCYKYENAVQYFMQNTAENEDEFSENNMERCY